MPTLIYRHLTGDMIETFKVVHGLYSTDCKFKLLLSHNIVIWGYRFKFRQSFKLYDLEKYIFANRIIALWNSSPDSVVSAESVSIFKCRLGKHWHNLDCKYDGATKCLTGSESFCFISCNTAVEVVTH